MNLWDSVQRGLEKASQEAARKARTQRLRTIIDGLARHINTQHAVLIGKTMELYTSGQLTQSELLPICQTLAELQQQMQQAQNELQQIQSNAPVPPPPPQLQGAGTAQQSEATMLYSTSGETVVTGPYAPSSDYQSYVDAGSFTAPPPAGAESFAGSELETAIAPPPPPDIVPVQTPAGATPDAPRYCPVCQAELNPSYAFCHNCGTLVQHNLAHMPTMRAGVEAEGSGQANTQMSEQETMRADGDAASKAEENKGV